jgi:hypothetical protein
MIKALDLSRLCIKPLSTKSLSKRSFLSSNEVELEASLSLFGLPSIAQFIGGRISSVYRSFSLAYRGGFQTSFFQHPLCAPKNSTLIDPIFLPEEFPVVLMIFLSLGAWRMSKRHVLTRNAASIEMLGAATVLCVDKTGTLTKGEMTVRRLFIAGGCRFIDVSGVGYEPKGEFLQDGKLISPPSDAEVSMLLKIGSLCNNASLEQDDRGAWTVVGDPTEGALIVAGEKTCFVQKAMVEEYPRFR